MICYSRYNNDYFEKTSKEIINNYFKFPACTSKVK